MSLAGATRVLLGASLSDEQRKYMRETFGVKDPNKPIGEPRFYPSVPRCSYCKSRVPPDSYRCGNCGAPR